MRTKCFLRKKKDNLKFELKSEIKEKKRVNSIKEPRRKISNKKNKNQILNDNKIRVQL